MKRLLIILLMAMPMTGHARMTLDDYLSKWETDSMWLVSRLQMYWSTHATDVFVNGELFDHVGGGRAPFPTIKYNGSRSVASQYNRPSLEEVVPFDDDEQGSVTFISKATGKLEKTHPSKTGCNIASVNLEIARIARDAAKRWQETGDDRYGRMAVGVLDAFLKGIYFRNVPQDMNHGHQQTLVGMTTFEVIHEDAIYPLCEAYRILRSWVSMRSEERGARSEHRLANEGSEEDDSHSPLSQSISHSSLPTPLSSLKTHSLQLYDAALKKWAENIIAGGVPHNNWDLFQAETIAAVAVTLDHDDAYDDHRGREYYLDYIMNQNSIRQWSVKRLAAFGFDREAHTWYECPGYSTTVLRDFAQLADELDEHAGIDLYDSIPMLILAMERSPEYLMPNRMICGFGDTHPNHLNTGGIERAIGYAKRHGKGELQARMERLLAAVKPDAPDSLIEQCVSSHFYAPNVSWAIGRTGMHPTHDLMYSLNGSLGNHQHANGISLELYGKGYVLGPDAGIGKTLYSGLDYAEYYSQFPAHNTVCVDGVSSYPVMMSQHGFDLVSADDQHTTVAFVEPESQSDQQRTVGIVKTSERGGYYVDVFRSRKRRGGDKMHDYFYHNLGQTMTLTAADGTSLDLRPTDELAFAGGHLYAYSYIYDKVSARTTKDVKATFRIDANAQLPTPEITMTMWMRGDEGREVFQALSPVNLEYERMPRQPYDVKKQPVLTFVARQSGEAWNHPFVAVFEPSSADEPSEIESVSFFTPKGKDKSAVGIEVRLKNGDIDRIVSTESSYEVRRNGRIMRSGE